MPAMQHPLVIELAGLVDGTLPPELAARVGAHLACCLLCRVKCQRFSGHAPSMLQGFSPLSAPNFRPIEALMRSQPVQPPVICG